MHAQKRRRNTPTLNIKQKRLRYQEVFAEISFFIPYFQRRWLKSHAIIIVITLIENAQLHVNGVIRGALIFTSHVNSSVGILSFLE